MHSSRVGTVRCSSRLLRGVSEQGWGFCPGGGLSRGLSAWWGGVSARLPSMNRMTDACENITLPQLHCRR